MRLFTNSSNGSLGMRLFTSLGINGNEVHEPEYCGLGMRLSHNAVARQFGPFSDLPVWYSSDGL